MCWESGSKFQHWWKNAQKSARSLLLYPENILMKIFQLSFVFPLTALIRSFKFSTKTSPAKLASWLSMSRSKNGSHSFQRDHHEMGRIPSGISMTSWGCSNPISWRWRTRKSPCTIWRWFSDWSGAPSHCSTQDLSASFISIVIQSFDIWIRFLESRVLLIRIIGVVSFSGDHDLKKSRSSLRPPFSPCDKPSISSNIIPIPPRLPVSIIWTTPPSFKSGRRVLRKDVPLRVWLALNSIGLSFASL